MAPKMGLMERRVDNSKRIIWTCSTCDLKGRATLVGLELGGFLPLPALKIEIFMGKVQLPWLQWRD
jgi:hypothetical protein